MSDYSDSIVFTNEPIIQSDYILSSSKEVHLRHFTIRCVTTHLCDFKHFCSWNPILYIMHFDYNNSCTNF